MKCHWESVIKGSYYLLLTFHLFLTKETIHITKNENEIKRNQRIRMLWYFLFPLKYVLM